MSVPLDLKNWDATTLLEALPDGAYITDPDRRIVFWNHAAEKITGWPKSEVVGRYCRDDILVHEDKDGHRLCGNEYCPLHRAIITGESICVGRLVFAQGKDGRRIPLEVTTAPLHDCAGGVAGGIEIFRDLSPTMEDMNRARSIQRATLQSDWPADARVAIGIRAAPCDLVGGDYHRCEGTGSGRYALLVADVTGHGVASALYAMQLRSLWEEGRARLERPAEFLGFLNERIHTLMGGSGGEFFATAAMACYDASRGVARLACAGHPAPLHLRGRTGFSPVEVHGLALGLVPGVEYAEVEVELARGDTLLLFTDGAFEISGPAEKELGVEGFRDLAAPLDFSNPDAALTALEDALLAYAQRPFLPDDLTILSLHRR